ncbi:MAG: phosphatidylglycerol lysyltransferase domain-containing protein [Tannerellaceae bacterium]|jgi:hypothetical protein|nr:phosphatidylglycerol lysyltransferase domain-containing protein [Tannerellaceae bacterium]
MLRFHPIRLVDRQMISDILRQYSPGSADYTFSNIYSWRALFHTECDVIEDTLVLRFVHNGVAGYMMPVGKKALDMFPLIFQDANERNRPFLMKGVTVAARDIIEQAYPERFNFEHDRDNDEYLYLSEQLVSLSGKGLQSKRNHINRFEAEYPDWEYVSVHSHTETRLCMEMLRLWMRTLPPETAASRMYDYRAAHTMLRHFKYFGLSGGLIRVGKDIIAFSLGEPLNDSTFVVHVEKAFSNIRGAYSLINRQFAKHEAAGYTFINREEDMGLANIRKAKLSYRPVSMVEHFTVTLR